MREPPCHARTVVMALARYPEPLRVRPSSGQATSAWGNGTPPQATPRGLGCWAAHRPVGNGQVAAEATLVAGCPHLPDLPRGTGSRRPGAAGNLGLCQSLDGRLHCPPGQRIRETSRRRRFCVPPGCGPGSRPPGEVAGGNTTVPQVGRDLGYNTVGGMV